MKHLIIISFLLLATGLGACKKETEKPSSFQLLTATPWRMVGISSQVGGAAPADSYSFIKACEKDNKYVFLADSSYVQLEGPTRCNAADPEVKSTSTWRLSADGLVLRLGITDNNVVMLTKDSLILQRNGPSSGTLYTYKFSPY